MVDPTTFITKYGYPDFPLVRYRGEGAMTCPVTTPFGHDIETFKDKNGKFTYRLHLGTDRSRGRLGDIFCPFDVDQIILDESIKSFGLLIRLIIKGADFEIRIAHCRREELDPDFLKAVKMRQGYRAGKRIGAPGNNGLSVASQNGTGIHTHTEGVSTGPRSSVLDTILKLLKIEIGTTVKIDKILSTVGHDRIDQVKTDLAVRKIKQNAAGEYFIGKHDITRLDYLDGKERTWYDLNKIFNGV